MKSKEERINVLTTKKHVYLCFIHFLEEVHEIEYRGSDSEVQRNKEKVCITGGRLNISSSFSVQQ